MNAKYRMTELKFAKPLASRDYLCFVIYGKLVSSLPAFAHKTRQNQYIRTPLISPSFSDLDLFLMSLES